MKTSVAKLKKDELHKKFVGLPKDKRKSSTQAKHKNTLEKGALVCPTPDEENAMRRNGQLRAWHQMGAINP